MQLRLIQREDCQSHNLKPRVSGFLLSLVFIAKHQFGNYVIQSLLERVPRDWKTELKNRLRENVVEISKSQYGRHVLMQMEKHK